MTAVYTIYAFAWIVMMACSYKDLVRLQFWVLAVILLGFLEKMLFVSEYGSVNTGHDRKSLSLSLSLFLFLSLLCLCLPPIYYMCVLPTCMWMSTICNLNVTDMYTYTGHSADSVHTFIILPFSLLCSLWFDHDS